MGFQAVIIGGSAGGTKAIINILAALKKPINIPIVIVLHTSEERKGFAALLSNFSKVELKEAEDKEEIKSDKIYIAPPGYHLQIEDELCFSLLGDKSINYSRPSIDVLFESAAEAYNGNLIGILLTGANSDGAEGLRRIEELGGKVIVQDPETAHIKTMPESGIMKTKNPLILGLDQISEYINKLSVSRRNIYG